MVVKQFNLNHIFCTATLLVSCWVSSLESVSSSTNEVCLEFVLRFWWGEIQLLLEYFLLLEKEVKNQFMSYGKKIEKGLGYGPQPLFCFIEIIQLQ
jgi:hypothetical protein